MEFYREAIEFHNINSTITPSIFMKSCHRDHQDLILSEKKDFSQESRKWHIPVKDKCCGCGWERVESENSSS
jgi:hypothetical protein